MCTLVTCFILWKKIHADRHVANWQVLLLNNQRQQKNKVQTQAPWWRTWWSIEILLMSSMHFLTYSVSKFHLLSIIFWSTFIAIMSIFARPKIVEKHELQRHLTLDHVMYIIKGQPKLHTFMGHDVDPMAHKEAKSQFETSKSNLQFNLT